MTTKRTLAAGAALGVFVASTIGGAVEAKTTKHHAAHKASGDAELRREVDELKSQVQVLEGRLNAQASVQQQTQAQVQATQEQVQTTQSQVQTAQAQAQTAQTQALAAQSAIATIPGTVKTEIASEPHVVESAGKRFTLQSGDGRYSISVTGRAQFDAGAYVGFNPNSPLAGPQELSNGVNARRARIGVTGTAGGNLTYAFIYDGGNSQDSTARGIQTAQIGYVGIKGAIFEVGYSDTFFTLDESTSSNDLMFLERATPSNIATSFNAGDFRSNAGGRFFGDRYWLGAYVTGPANGDSHTTNGERFGAIQRVAFQVLQGRDYTLHLGGGASELIRAPNAGHNLPDTISLSDQPEIRIDPTTLLATGTIGTALNPVTGGDVFNGEAAGTFGPFYAQGEYYHYEIRRLNLANASFDGGYGEVSWTLTGEQRKYNPSAGAYLRISPRHPFSPKDGGWGAWEIAGRYSYIDLVDNFTPGTPLSSNLAGVNGGRQSSYSAALNWYPNDLIRMMLDYNHVDYRKLESTAGVMGVPLGSRIGASDDVVSIRFQVAY